ncbi:unnamed protein product [Leptosia nina]|uniref:Uncharacterized protein n=1 Tax=Leptosia nina TaxID=320188 RepID=A0AAV1JB06_9NEOP
MPYINEFVLVFIHIALSLLEAANACNRDRKHCCQRDCRPCNQFGGPKVRPQTTLKAMFILVVLLMWTAVFCCKRKSPCPKYCIPCKYKGPIIEVLYPKQGNKTILLSPVEE